MTGKTTMFFVCSGLLCASALAQSPAPPPARPDTQATAYYNFAMGHIYAEQAAMYGYRSEFVDKAIEHYKAALKADPGAAFVSEELTDLYIQAGKLADAIAEAEDMLKRTPDNLDARRMLGRIYSRLIQDPQNRLNEERLKQATEQYRKIVEKAPKDTDSWLMLGRLYKVAQNSVESEKAYKKALELDPDNEFALSGLAVVYSDLGDSQGAIGMWKRLVERNPNPRTLRALADAYEQVNDYSAQAQTLRRAAELAPKDMDIKKSLAEAVLLSGDVDGSLSLYNELVQFDPKDARLQLRLSQIYREKRDFAQARAAQQRALELEPNSTEIRYNEVILLEREGKVPEAIAALKQIADSTAPRHTPTAQEQVVRARIFEDLGRLYRGNEQWALAVESFQKAGQMNPAGAALASAQVVDTYRQARDYPKAEAEANAAFKKYPNDRVVKMTRASLLADLGRTEEAAAATRLLLDGKNDRETYLVLAQVYDKGKKYAEMAQALDAAEKLSDDKQEKEGVIFMRGAMFEKMHKLELAEAEFRKVLALNPNNASALNYLGYMLADRSLRLPEAEKLIQRALELEPNNGAFLDSLGWVFFRQGKLDDAVTYLRQSLDRTSTDPTVHDHLGDVYLQQGRVKDAVQQWEASLKFYQTGAAADADPVDVAKVQKKLESARVRLAKEGR